MRIVVATILSLFICTLVTAAETHKPDFKVLADSALGSESMLKAARMDQKELVRELKKAFKSKDTEELTGAVRLVHALGKDTNLKDIVKLLTHEDVADAAQEALVCLPGSKASKEVKKLWDRLAKEDEGMLPFLADLIIEAPINLDTLEWLNKDSSEDAQDVLASVLERIGMSELGKDQTKRIELLGKAQKKSASMLPVFLPNAYDSMLRYGGNVQAGVGESFALDIKSVERAEGEGLSWKLGVLLAGDKAMTEINIRNTEGFGYTMTIEPSVATVGAGGKSTKVKADYSKDWVVLEFSLMPYVDLSTPNFAITANGQSFGPLSFEPNAKGEELLPSLSVAVTRGAFLASDGGLNKTVKLHK